MKKFIEYTIKTVIILCSSIVIGALLLLLVFQLPTAMMKDNVQRSTAIYDYEGVYPQLMAGYKMSQLDNCTDATMLLNAITPPTNPCKDAMLVFRTEYYDRNPVGSLTDYVNDVDQETYSVPYPRYWHGYLVVLKPLLMFFDVSDIRIINMSLQFALLLYVIWLMMHKGLNRYLLAFIIPLLMMNPIAVPLSFQFSTVSYIMLFSVILVLHRQEWSFSGQMIFFLVIGITTAYFDFLTFPLVGLYFPLIFMLMREGTWKKAVKLVIAGSVAWVIGYAGMWCGKWLIGSLITGSNILADALSRATNYTDMEYDGQAVNFLQVILKNIQVFLKWPFLLVGIGVAIYEARNLIHAKTQHPLSALQCIPFLIIAFTPLCWYIMTGTHSYEHYWFTYRELCVSIFAVLAGIVKVCEHCD